MDHNVAKVGGSTISTAAAGIQKVGIADGTGNAITSTASALDVNIKSGNSTSTTTDEGVWTAGASALSPSGGVFNDSAAVLVTGQQGTERLTPNRAVHANLRNNSGVEIGTAGAPLRIDPTGTTAQPVSGTVTANAGTNLNTSLLALETGGNLASAKTNTDNLSLTQGSATSGQKGNLTLGAVTTAAPTYTTAQSNPLSLTTSGSLRVDGTATTQPVSAASLPLPLNASTSIKQSDGSQKTQVVDASGNVVGSTANALDVNIKSGGGGLSVVDEAAWTAGVSAMVPAGATFNDSAAVLTTGQQGALRATNNRALHANIRNAAGTELATNTNPLRTDPTGTTTQPVSGTVTANAGTNLNTSALALDTSVNGILLSQGSTSSGQKGALVQGAVTASAPSYTTAQTSPLSLDAAGNLRTSVNNTVTIGGTVTTTPPSNASTNIAQVSGANVVTAGTNGTLAIGGNQAAGNTISTNTNPILMGGSDYGGTAKLQTLRVDSSGNAQVAVTNTPSVSISGTPAVTANAGTNLNTSLLAVETGGNLATTATNTSGLNNTVGTAGSAIPTKGIIVQGSDGTTARALKTDASGNVNVNIQGTPAVSGTVTSNIGTTNGIALDTSVTGLQVAQGSTTSGQRGDLIQGAVTTAAPSYTTTQTSPLSLDTSGNLRTSVNNTVTVSGTVTANQGGAPWSDNVTQFGGAAIATGVGASGSGIPRVTVANDSNILATQSGTWTVQPGNTANTTPWLVSLAPSTSGGWSVSSQTALTNSAVAVKASAGQFGGYMFFNPNSAVIYVQVFNVASGGVTVGSTTPTYVVPIPAASAANVEFANGIAHSTAITVTATTTATGAGAPTTALTGFVVYK